MTDAEILLFNTLADWAASFRDLPGEHPLSEMVSLTFHIEGLQNMVLARAGLRDSGLSREQLRPDGVVIPQEEVSGDDPDRTRVMPPVTGELSIEDISAEGETS